MNQYKKIFSLGIAILFCCNNIFAQATTRKGKMYFYWGYNRAAFAKSTLRMKGADYDITLHKAIAKDRQTEFTLQNYFAPQNITIPQTNFKIGYYVKNNLSVNIGVDHMKYVMQQNQILSVSGTISQEGNYRGIYNKTPVQMTKDFLQFEHTNGLNYINVEIEKYFTLKNFAKHFTLQATAAAGIGALMPRTDATFLNYQRNDKNHFAGAGITINPGLYLQYRNFFYRSMLKAGFMYMPDILLHKNGIEGRAAQNILVAQMANTLGYNINLHGRKFKVKQSENTIKNLP